MRTTYYPDTLLDISLFFRDISQTGFFSHDYDNPLEWHFLKLVFPNAR